MDDEIFINIYGNIIIIADKNVTLKKVIILNLMIDPQKLRTTACN